MTLCYRLIRCHKRTARRILALRLLTPLLFLPQLRAVGETALNAGSVTNAFLPGKYVGMQSNVDLAPLVPTDPREDGDVGNGEVRATNKTLSLELLVEHSEKALRLRIETGERMNLLLLRHVGHVAGITQFITERGTQTRSLPSQPLQNVVAVGTAWI